MSSSKKNKPLSLPPENPNLKLKGSSRAPRNEQTSRNVRNQSNNEKMIEISALVRRELDTVYGKKEVQVPLVYVCEQVEEYLQKLAYRLSLKDLNNYSAEIGAYHTTSPSEYFTFDGNIYQLKIVEYPTDNSVLSLIIQSTNPEKANFIRKATTVKFESLGRFNEIRVSTDEIFYSVQTVLAETVQCVFESGYRWLAEYIRLSLDKIRSCTTVDVYSHIRKVLPEHIARQVWLYAIIEKNGIYIPDAVAFNSALNAASERKFLFKESPLELVADFSTRLTEFDKVFSKIAIAEDKSVVGNISSADYAGSGIELAEKAIYQSNQFIIQPLVREGRTLLTAAYPSDIRQHVEVVLENERERIRQIIVSNESTFRNALKKIKEGGVLPKLEPKHFEYAGAFIRGLLDTQS